jgi:heme iron utilization protein
MEAVRLAKTLVRHARFGALAFLDPSTGNPGVSRVAVASDQTGVPVTLISRLSAHTKALMVDPRCSLLVGEPAKGDPLTHPRISVHCVARFLEHGSIEEKAVAERYLRCNPKAKLYAGFADFTFVRLDPAGAGLNGGFGKAYLLTAADLLSPAFDSHKNEVPERNILAMLNGELAPLMASRLCAQSGATPSKWKAVSFDSEGVDVVAAKTMMRIWLDHPASTHDELMTELRDR